MFVGCRHIPNGDMGLGCGMRAFQSFLLWLPVRLQGYHLRAGNPLFFLESLHGPFKSADASLWACPHLATCVSFKYAYSISAVLAAFGLRRDPQPFL